MKATIDDVLVGLFALVVAMFLFITYKQQHDMTSLRVEAVKLGYAEWKVSKKDNCLEFCWK